MMRSRLKFAAAVTAGILSTGLICQSEAAIVYTPVAVSTLGTVNTGTITEQGTPVPTNPNLTYTTAGSPNSDTTETTNPITGEYFSTFGTPCINQVGDVVFASVDSGTANVQATQTTTAAQNVNALNAYQGGNLLLVAHEGTYAPDKNGDTPTGSLSSGTWNSFTANTPSTASTFIGYNGTSDVITDYATTKANKTNGGSDDVVSGESITATLGYPGIYSSASGPLTLAVRGKDTLGGVTLNYLNASATYAVAVNPSGTFASLMDAGTSNAGNGDGNSSGIVSNVGGTLQFITEGGQACPVVAGATYNGPTAVANQYVPTINSSGQLAFRSYLQNSTGSTTITTNNSVALLSSGGGTLHLVAQGYGQAAGCVAGDAYSNTGIGNPDINNAGQAAFVSSLTTNTALGAGDIITSTSASGTKNSSGLFLDNAGSGVSLLARAGGTDPNLPAGTVYSSFGTSVLSGTGQVLSLVSLSNASNTAALTAGTTSALYTFSLTGSPTLIARNGSPAPGTPDVFLGISTLSYAINDLGESAFTSTLAATVNGTSVGTGLFAQDLTGSVQELLQTGESWTLSPGDVSTISSFTSLSQSGGQDGKILSWNDNETLAVDLTFANGQQGIYTIGVSAVPEPGSLGLLAMSSGLLLRRRNRGKSARA